MLSSLFFLSLFALKKQRDWVVEREEEKNREKTIVI